MAVIASLFSSLNKQLGTKRLSLGCCCLCKESCQNISQLCDTCFADLARFSVPTKQIDATTVPDPKAHLNLLQWPALHQLFSKCAFDALYAVAPYQWPYNQWLQKLKYQRRFDIAELLSHLLVTSWQEYQENTSTAEGPVLISVPLHTQKWGIRGYNQAHLLAEKFALQLGYDYQPNLIFRTKKTTAQVGKSGVERRKNLHGAFEVNKQFTTLPKVVMIIDDVVTTGATCNEIAKLLKKNGVEKVLVFSVCISLPNADSTTSHN